MTCFRTRDGKTLHKYCVENGITYNNVVRRIEWGYSMEDAIKGGKKATGDRHYNQKIFYKGKAIVELCKNTAQYERVLARRKKGKDLGEVLKQEGLI